MPVREQIVAAVMGAASAVIYLLFYAAGGDVPLMLLPTLPLFMVGLSRPVQTMLFAGFVGVLTALFTAGAEAALFYTALIAVPVLLFAPAAILRRHGHFVPVGTLMADLSVYAALIYGAMIVHYAPQGGGIQQMIADYMQHNFSNEDPETQEMAHMLGGTLAFLVFAASAWWWVLLLYAHAVVANWLLGFRHQRVRHSLALKPFALPAWFLAVLAVCGILSLGGAGNWAFAAQAIILIMLLPYFLLGLTVVQAKIRAWPGHGLALFLLYFLTLSLLWPALIIAAAGVWAQCRALTAKSNVGE